MNWFRNQPSSLLAYFLVTVVISASMFFGKLQGDSKPNYLSWDVYGYYCYLPFHFIYDDPGQQNQGRRKDLFSKYPISSTYYQAVEVENGKWVSNYSIGMSYLYAPLFFIAHVVAGFTEYPQDGFSYPYQMLIVTGMLLYIFIGLYYLRKVLLIFFDERITALTLILITLGTTFFHEAFNDTLEPHAAVFAFYALLLYNLEKWYSSERIVNAVGIGLITGLILMMRGSEFICVILILLWGVNSMKLLWERTSFVFRKFAIYLLMGGIALAVMLPQFIYFYRLTGDFLFNNYKNAEGFNFSEPHIYDFLFSFKKGVFIYTPIAALAVFGFFVRRFWQWKSSWSIFLFTISNIYLLSSWLVWWGGASFGSRYFVQSLVFLSFPLGFLLQNVLKTDGIKKMFLAFVITALLSLNLFQTWQYFHNVLHQSRMSFEYYKAVFLKTVVPVGAMDLLEPELDAPEHEDFPGEDGYSKRTLFYANFDSLNMGDFNRNYLDTMHKSDGNYSMKLEGDNQYSPTLHIPLKVLHQNGYPWLGITVSYFADFPLSESPVSIIACVNIHGTGRTTTKYRGFDLEKIDFKQGEWNTVTFYYLPPARFSENDELAVYVYTRGSKTVYIDEFKVVSFETIE